MTKAGLIKKIVVLVMILIVPGFLYYLLTVKGKNMYHPLPKFGPKTLAKTSHKVKGKIIPDTLFHALADFQLKDADGKTVSLKTFEDKIFIADLFYTNCPTVCNTMNNYMDSLARNYAKNSMVEFVSITVDPQHDSETVLKTYREKFKDHNPKWMFLTGDTSTIYNLARLGFLVNAVDEGKGNFIYDDRMILIDSHKRIRGYYHGASYPDVMRLNDEIKVLISEELLTKEAPLY